jgi:cysteine-S-conjugate beta-lyase
MKYDFETSPIMPGLGNIQHVRWPRRLKDKGIESYRGSIMHFPIPPQIVSAFTERAGGTFGYTQMDEPYVDAVLNWMKTRRHWDARREHLINYFGAMQTIVTAIRAFSERGDGVIVCTPTFSMYKLLIETNQRRQVVAPLTFDRESYHFDQLALAQAMAARENRMLLICNPNNPTGTVRRPAPRRTPS